MGHVRDFRREDIPAAARLWTQVFGKGAPVATDLLEAYFAEVFFENPWHAEGLPSLVYEDDQRALAGFLGVVPRRMLFEGTPIRAVVSTQFMVDRSRSPGFAAIELLRTFLAGPQDLSFSDGSTDTSQKIWERVGGKVSLLYSLEWTRTLQPARHLVARLKRRNRLAPLLWTARPPCWAFDQVMARLPIGPFRARRPSAVGEEATTKTLLECLSHLPGRQALRPDYQEESITWVCDQARRTQRHGALHGIVVRSSKQEIDGWYLYYAKRGGVSEVLQIGARETAVDPVLDHLFNHARSQGSAAISGQMEPRMMRELSNHHCRFVCHGLGVLFHSKHQAIVDAIHRGDAFLSRLEGEWWLRFSDFRTAAPAK